MESKLKPFSCQVHPNEFLVRATFDSSAGKVLLCVECLLEFKPTSKVISINDYFNQFLELNKSLPNFSSTPTGTSEGFPDEINGFLSSESESLAKLSAHIEDEKAKFIKFYDNLKQEVLKVIDDKKNDAIASLNSQLQTFKSNFNSIRNQSEVIFNGRFPVTFGSLDEAITKANKCASESELAIFIQALNDQINQRKSLFVDSKNIESEIKKYKEDLFENVRDFRDSLSGELPSFAVNHDVEKGIESLKKTSEMLSKQLTGLTELTHPFGPVGSRLSTSSQILSSVEEETLISKEISKSGRVRYKLLYRGSRDGYQGSDYHRLCDEKSPRLVLVKSTCGSRFGGYTEKNPQEQPTLFTLSSMSLQNLQKQKSTFLFNLDNKEIYLSNFDEVLPQLTPYKPQSGPCIEGQGLIINDRCDIIQSYSYLSDHLPKSQLLGSQNHFQMFSYPNSLCRSGNRDQNQFLVKEIEVYAVHYDKNDKADPLPMKMPSMNQSSSLRSLPLQALPKQPSISQSSSLLCMPLQSLPNLPSLNMPLNKPLQKVPIQFQLPQNPQNQPFMSNLLLPTQLSHQLAQGAPKKSNDELLAENYGEEDDYRSASSLEDYFEGF